VPGGIRCKRAEPRGTRCLLTSCDACWWAGYTFNGWVGCTEIEGSPACDKCYAKAGTRRAGLDLWGDDKPRQITSPGYWKQPARWNLLAKESGERRGVFCASYGDVFEDRPELAEPRARMLAMFEELDGLDLMLLTKRIENVRAMVPPHWLRGQWPGHVWLGATVETQEWAERRVPILCSLPAPIRFLSVEPLLGRVSVAPWLAGPEGVDWIIIGGESGGGARALELDATEALVEECVAAEVPVFVKQLGTAWAKQDRAGSPNKRLIAKLDPHGSNPYAWPAWARRRELPRAA
jgi:protein gp37